jgi:hypothetical protein
MGAPAPPPSPHIADFWLMQPAAIAAAPIHAAPVKNSRLFWFMFFSISRSRYTLKKKYFHYIMF